MNRKVIGSLLGGGVAVTLSSFGGLKLSDKISYDSKVRHFGGLRSTANKYFLSENRFDGYRLPRWEDDGIWKELYSRNAGNKIYLGKDGNKNDNVKFLSSPEDLKNTCYEIIMKEAGKYENCSPTTGWCESCLMGKGWYGTSENY